MSIPRNIIFSPFAKGVKSRDMSDKEFYKVGYVYYLLNGANANISSDGDGTTEAIKTLGKNLHNKPDHYFNIKFKIDSAGNETGFSSKDQNTPYFFKENEENEEKTQIAGVFHVYGKDFRQIRETHNRDKSRLENIDAVREYYGRIIKAVNRMVRMVSDKDKKYILYLARVPGNIFKGGVETVIGMIQAINGLEQKENLTYQIDVSRELYYLVYDYLFFSTPNTLKSLYDKCSDESPDSNPENKLVITGPIKEAFKRSKAGLPFVHLYKRRVYEEIDEKMSIMELHADEKMSMSIMVLNVDLQATPTLPKCEHMLNLNLLNDDCSERQELSTVIDGSSDIKLIDDKISICDPLYNTEFKDKKYDKLILIIANGDTTEEIEIVLTKIVLDKKKYEKYTLDTLLFLTNAPYKNRLQNILEKLRYVDESRSEGATCQYQRSDIRWFENMLKRYKEPFKPHITFMKEMFKEDFTSNHPTASSIEDLFRNTDFLKNSENAIIFYENKIMVYIINLGKNQKFSYFVKIDNVTIEFYLDKGEEDTFFGIYNVRGVGNDKSCIYKLEYRDVFGEVLSSPKSKPKPELELETDLKHDDVPPELEQLQNSHDFLRREKEATLTTEDLFYMVTDRKYGQKQLIYNDPHTNCDKSPSKCGSPVYICVLCKKQIWYHKDAHVPDKNKCDCSIPLYVQNIHLCDEKEKRGDISCLNGIFDLKVSFGDNIKLDVGTLEKVDGVNTFLVNVDDLDDPVRLYDTLNDVLVIIMNAISTKEFFQIIFIGEEDKNKNFSLRAVKLTNKHPLIQNNISPAYCTLNGKFSLDRVCSKILWYIRFLIMQSSPYLRKQQTVPMMLFRKKSKVKQTIRSLKKIKSKKSKPKKSLSPKPKKPKKSKPKKSLKSPRLKKSNKKG